jgi:hypothetical protein
MGSGIMVISLDSDPSLEKLPATYERAAATANIPYKNDIPLDAGVDS